MTTLKDAEISIRRFLSEARECASRELGFAALSTLFPVILSVAEALNPMLKRDDDLVHAFVPLMLDKSSWLATTSGCLRDDAIASQLTDVRNGLAHQLSLPPDVLLSNTNTEAAALSAEQPGKLVISTVGLVDAVETTVEELVRRHPTAVFDPNARIVRGPADRLEIFSVSASGFGHTSGSSSSIPSSGSAISPVRLTNPTAARRRPK